MYLRRLDAVDWALLALGVVALGLGIKANLPPPTPPALPPLPPPPPQLLPIPPSAAVVVELDASPTGAPVTVEAGQTLTFNAPTGGTIDTISKMVVNAASYSAAAQNVGSLTTPVTWHDANGSYTTTIPITVTDANA